MKNTKQNVGLLLAKMAGANSNMFSARNAARMRAVSKAMRNYVGTPKSLRVVKSVKNRAAKTKSRRNYLINKKRRGVSPLSQEEKEFLQYYNYAKNKGKAYMKSLAPYMIRPAATGRFSSNPLTGYEMFRNMKNVFQSRPGTYIVTPVIPAMQNVNRRSGQPTKAAQKLIARYVPMNATPALRRWKTAFSKIANR